MVQEERKEDNLNFCLHNRYTITLHHIVLVRGDMHERDASTRDVSEVRSSSREPAKVKFSKHDDVLVSRI